MTKNSITFVLIGIMMAGNPLPLWADAAKRTPEYRHGASQDKISRLPNSLGMDLSVEPVDGDTCDLQAALAAANATLLAVRAKIAIIAAATARLDAIIARELEIEQDPNMTLSEILAALDLLALERQQINVDVLLQNLAVDAALAVALALIELNRLICKSAYQNQA